MKHQKFILMGVSALLIGVFFFGASAYRKNEEARSLTMSGEHTERLIRPYSPSVGPEDARVTIVEFLDPECEACGALYPQLKKVMAEFDGQIRFVVRYMPFHKNSTYAVSVLEGAKKQGKYWEAIELAFASQGQWANHQNPRPEMLLPIMKTIGLDVETLSASLKDPEIEAKLKQDIDDGNFFRVNATPTIYINGKIALDIQPEKLKEKIRAAMAFNPS